MRLIVSNRFVYILGVHTYCSIFQFLILCLLLFLQFARFQNGHCPQERYLMEYQIGSSDPIVHGSSYYFGSGPVDAAAAFIRIGMAVSK